MPVIFVMKALPHIDEEGKQTMESSLVLSTVQSFLVIIGCLRILVSNGIAN